MGLLANKVAVITGSSRGFGLAMAKAFAGEGASVVLASRSNAAVQKAADEIRSAFPGVQVTGIACDTSDMAQVKALAEHALETSGRFDVWVNNAGISPAYGPTVHIQPEEFVKTTQTNVLGTYYGSVVAMRHFLPRHAGKLINIAGAGARGPVPMQSAYAASKAWIRNFTLALAKEYPDSGVGIHVLNPGMMMTDMLTHVAVVAGFEHKLDALPRVLRVLGKPPEVPARKAVWLASSATDGRTGLEVSVFNPLAAMFGFMREGIRGVAGRPDDWPRPNITSVPPAIP
jgi:NAD(P)-dependent dehydrogenase (short-subunit alcohol dehydrogenase family)